MTTMTQAEILALANEIAEVDDDMNEAQAGGGGFGRRLPVGWSVARLTSYVEKGKHIELYQGKAKDPALMFTLGFELFSPQYLNEDGTPYFIETRNISRSRNEKARAFKLFKAMNYKGLSKNFAQLLGRDVFLVEIKDYVPKSAPVGTEPRSVIGEVRAGIDVVTNQEYGCPPAKSLFLFSWAMPTLAGWDSFFIEGTNDKGESKNWKQSEITGATDFVGSPLEGLLLANGRPIPAGRPQKTAAGAAPAGAQPAGAAPAGAVAPVAPTVPAAAPVAPAAAAAAVPNVAAASAPVTPSVAAPAPAVSSAPAVAATPVVQAAAPAAPVVAAAAPVVPVAPVVSAPAVATPVVPAPLAQ